MGIIIVGLGPGNPAHLTREAWEVLSQAGELYLRTTQHPTVRELPRHLTLHSFDSLYESSDDFARLYNAIAERVVTLGKRQQGVVYAVPGHPLVGESSVQRILARARAEGLSVRLVAGLSFFEPVLSALEIDGLADVQLADATDLAAAHHPPLDPDRPALVGQLYGQRLASDVKLTLMNAYPDDHPVTLVQGAGTDAQSLTTIPLYELDRGQPIDHLTTLYVPPLPYTAGLAAFQDTVARLRAPGGCPWDQEQTHLSLRPALLEESYEVLEALDAEDLEALREELGDLLMQVAMHTQMATEEGAFRFADVIHGIDGKLKRRHPHVFGDVQVRDSADVLRNWEAIKAGERAHQDKKDAEPSQLEGVPRTLPALARAEALGERAARTGFDWPDVAGVLDKVREEAAELRKAAEGEEREWELGDLLFALTNLARWLHVDAESALRRACDRFTDRYAAMEREARGRGVELRELTAEQMDDLWEKAKRNQ